MKNRFVIIDLMSLFLHTSQISLNNCVYNNASIIRKKCSFWFNKYVGRYQLIVKVYKYIGYIIISWKKKKCIYNTNIRLYDLKMSYMRVIKRKRKNKTLNKPTRRRMENAWKCSRKSRENAKRTFFFFFFNIRILRCTNRISLSTRAMRPKKYSEFYKFKGKKNIRTGFRTNSQPCQSTPSGANGKLLPL